MVIRPRLSLCHSLIHTQKSDSTVNEDTVDLHVSTQPFMEWRYDKSGIWIDESGNTASEKESSLLDSILRLTDEKRRLMDAIKILANNITSIQSVVDSISTNAPHEPTTEIINSELINEVNRALRVAKLIGGMHEL